MFQGATAHQGPAKVQHAGGEEDKDPGVDDGVNRDEAQGDEVQAMSVHLHYRVDVNPDLRDG